MSDAAPDSEGSLCAVLGLICGDGDRDARLLEAGVTPAQLQRFRRRSASWLRSTTLRGFGVARRLVAGRRTDELALKVYVDRKLPRRRLEHPAPKRLSIPGVDGAVDIDVEAIGPLRAQACRPARRPALLGSSIGHVDGAAGTLGALVHPRGDPSEIYLLTAAHVLAPWGPDSVGKAVLQPAVEDCGRTVHRVATLSRYTPMRQGKGFPNAVDAAIAKLHDPGAISTQLRDLGARARGLAGVSKSQQVFGVGRTTGLMLGEVRDTNFHARIDFVRPDKRYRIGFRNQILCTRMSMKGDSGALILDRRHRAVGLLIGGSASHSVITPIATVLWALGVELI